MDNNEDDFMTALHHTINEVVTSNDDKQLFASLIVEAVHAMWAGQIVYIKKANTQLNDRDHLVISEFNGNNRRELCRKFGISEVSFYRIIKRVANKKKGGKP